jgi:hypothetical protein
MNPLTESGVRYFRTPMRDVHAYIREFAASGSGSVFT